MDNIFIRIFANIVILSSVFFFPWWFPAVLAIVCVFLFENYFEILLFGLILDFLYASSEAFSLISMLFTFAATILLIVSIFVKRNLAI